ncbi:T cell receptor gamma 3, partial [Clarias magur]
EKKESPKVSVFPVSKEQGHGTRVLLCQARDMFPNFVKFTWVDPSGGTVEASQEGYDLLEQTDNEEKRITSMLIVDQSKASSYKYKCLVKHETGDQSIFIPIGHYAVGGWVKVFGSGTRLYVTDQEKKEPAVSIFPVSNEKNGKHVLLCKAQGMFPNLVKFKWNDASGGEVQLSQGGYELLEQTDNEEVRITSMLIVDKSKSFLNKYKCTVKHEKGDFYPPTSKDETPVPPTCPPTNTPNEAQEDNLIS